MVPCLLTFYIYHCVYLGSFSLWFTIISVLYLEWTKSSHSVFVPHQMTNLKKASVCCSELEKLRSRYAVSEIDVHTRCKTDHSIDNEMCDFWLCWRDGLSLSVYHFDLDWHFKIFRIDFFGILHKHPSTSDHTHLQLWWSPDFSFCSTMRFTFVILSDYWDLLPGFRHDELQWLDDFSSCALLRSEIILTRARAPLLGALLE